MVTEVKDYPLLEVTGVSTSKGVALTATMQLINLPMGMNHLYLTGWNFSTAVVVRWLLNPYLAVVKTTDGGQSATSYSAAANDADAATDVVLSSIPTLANGGALYVGAHQQFRGVRIDVDAPNGAANVLTVEYWTGTAWADITATDGTTSGGASMAVDGDVTWTVPTDWARSTLRTGAALADPAGTRPDAGPLKPITNDLGPGDAGERLFWTRWKFSAACDSSTTLNSMLSMNRRTSYFETLSGQLISLPFEKRIGGISVIEALTDAGTASLLVGAGATVNQDAGNRGFS